MTIRSVAIISAGAFSLVRFKGALIAELAARGIRVHALAPDHDAASRRALTALGAEPVDIALQRTGLSPLQDIRDMAALTRLLRRLRPDATIAYFVKPVVYGTFAATLARVPMRAAFVEGLGYFFTPRDRETAKVRIVRLILRTLMRVALALSHRVFFLNADDPVDLLGARSRISRRTLRLRGVGVDLAEFPPAPVPEGPPSFLMVARLLREKGVAEFVEAARLVLTTHPQARFVLAGGTDSNPGAIGAAEADGWNALPGFTWLGEVDDVPARLAEASVFALPSHREGAPRSTQEAMAMGRAVITTTAPGCRETVVDGVNGYLVPPRDAEALAEAMLRFLDDPGLAARMGAESRRLAEAWFDVRAINAEILRAMGID